jgi:phosphoglycerol transferase MdoB-like AlkP superfamily enzyme
MIPNHYTFAWKIPGLLLISLSLLRLQTILFNFALFDAASFDLISALRFDISLIAYMSLPLTILIFVASRLKNPTTGIWMIHTYGIIAFQVILIPELWDLIYLNYTAKRASFDVYAFYAIGEDSDQFGSLAQRFWYVLVLYFIWTFAFILGVRKIGRSGINSISLFRSIGLFFISSSIYFLLARNSFGPKPLGIADALKIQHPTSAQFILNSPFVVLKTLQNKSLSRTTLIPLNLEKKHANPRMNISNKGEPLRPNIMFIIVESLGNQQLNQQVNGIPLTPFLDKIATEQMNTVATEGLAEGKTSIECLPALFAGIPSWLETPFILSNYSTNTLTGFPSICNQHGYETYFVHGAKEGSMRFDALASSLGFKHQLYRDDLPTSNAETGSWGLHDHEVFKHITNKLNGHKKPFMMTFFTLSTHEPYDIPQRFKNKYKIPTAEAASYRHFDDQLRLFFEQNKRKKWFKNTMFVITGDHTPVHLDNAQYKIQDYYSVPILIIPPDGMKQPFKVKEQKAIIPTLCKALNWNVSLYSYVNQKNQDAIRYLNGIFYIWNDEFELQYNETKASWRVLLKKVKNPSHFGKKTLTLKIGESKTRFLSLLQRFRKDLRLNRTHR